MKKIDLHAFVKNIPLLISVLAALCLFAAPSKLVLVLAAAVFGAALVAALFNKVRPEPIPQKGIAVVLAVWCAVLGGVTFCDTWVNSSVLAAVSGRLGLSASILTVFIALLGCGVGFYAMYVLGCWAVALVTGFLKEQGLTANAGNWKKNWYLPVSAAAFFCMEKELTFVYFIGVPLAVGFAGVAAAVLERKSGDGWGLKLFSLLTCAGICWARQSGFSESIVGILCGVLSLPFVYVCVSFLWRKLLGIFRELSMKGWEPAVYAALLVVTLIAMSVVFQNTDAFYGTIHDYDVIYTSDSPKLVKDNAFLTLTYAENDLRQPLFAVFAAPFAGLPYFLGRLFALPTLWQVTVLNFAQAAMLFFANLLLAQLMELTGGKRLCFMLLLSCSYTYPLFVLMMEQYVTAYFWLILFLYLACTKKRPDRLALWGAGGSLLTSAVLLPLTSEKNPLKDFKGWFADMVKYGLEFAAMMLAFCRLDVILGAMSDASALTRFTGKELTFWDKVCQFTAFVRSCFAAPDAGAELERMGYPSWQQSAVTGICVTGVVVLLLAAVSVLVNRDKKSSRIAGFWAAFSFVMLCVLGWGTQENGLILYALYFGWAFAVLLFQLVERIEKKLGIRFLVPLVSAAAVAALLAANLPGMKALIDFALTYYPI